MPTQLNGLGLLLRQLIGARTPVLLTTPVVLRSTSKVKVIIGYTPLSLSGPVTLPNNMLNLLADRAAVLYGVRVELVLVRIGTPIMDASMLAQYLGSLLGGSAAKGYTFKACMRVLTKHLALAMRRFNAHAVDLQGVKVRVSGRLATEPTRPRQTVQEYSLGTFNGSKALIQSGSYTVTNAKGSMTVKVWLGLKQA